jgi:hypothetical protein
MEDHNHFKFKSVDIVDVNQIHIDFILKTTIHPQRIKKCDNIYEIPENERNTFHVPSGTILRLIFVGHDLRLKEVCQYGIAYGTNRPKHPNFSAMGCLGEICSFCLGSYAGTTIDQVTDIGVIKALETIDANSTYRLERTLDRLIDESPRSYNRDEVVWTTE